MIQRIGEMKKRSLFQGKGVIAGSAVVLMLFLMYGSVVLADPYENVRVSLVNVSDMTVTVQVQCDPVNPAGCDEWGSDVCIVWEAADFFGMAGSNWTRVSSTGTFSHTYTVAGTYCIGLMCGDCEGTCALETLGDDGCWIEGSGSCAGVSQFCLEVTVPGGSIDTTDPTVTIQEPTASPTYATSTSPIVVSGQGSDNVGVTQLTWANDRGGSGPVAIASSWTSGGITYVTWSAIGIVLQSGSNVITITAQDAAGNSSADIITVTYTPPDTIAPTVTIASPTTASTYTTTSLSLTLAGTATDNVGVTQVTWANNRGGSGTTVGTTSWTAAGIALQSGSNVITITSRDAAGNSGTDTLTVNCTPPAGAFSVTPSPSTTSVVEGQNNIVASTYSALAVGGGSFTVTSDQGSFLTQGGTQLGTVDTSVSIKVVSGRGMSTETVTLPPKYITAALNQKANRIIYQRIFTYGGDSAISEVTMQIVPVSAGAFTITRLALRFEGEPSPGRATVARNALCPTVFADLTYTGSGTLRAQWKVDGQILGFVTQQLYPGIEKVSIKSPDVPPFPTYAMGRHSVEFEIIEPTPGFTEPVIYYDVTEGEGEIAPGLIRLISPADNATVPMPSGPGSYPEFRWQAVNTKYTYRFEIIPGGLRAEETPLVMAEMATGSYTLSQMDVERLSRSLPYRWRVRAYNGQKIIGASVFRMVYFSAPEGTKGNIEFRNLNITEMPEETSFFRWLLPKSAYAEEGGQTGETVFNVTAGKTVVITTDLANDTNVTKTGIRVEFVVDGEVVDVSFVQSLAPDETVTVEGVYDVSDAKTHTLEIRAVEGEGEAAEILASVSGSLAGEEAAPTKGAPQGDENRLVIGDFTIQLTEVTNDDINNYAGTGTIDVPFIGSTLNVEFSGLGINNNKTEVLSGTVEISPDEPWEYELDPAVIAINAFTFAHDGATCQGHVEIAMPFASFTDKLVMDFTDVGIHPDDGLSGTVTLAQNFTVDLSGILLGFGISLAQGSSVTLTGNGISSSLNGSVTLPDAILELANASGIGFSALAIKSDGGFTGTAELGNSSISGTNFGINGTVTLDFTTTESPGVKSGDKEWMGVYVSSANLAMPSDIPIPDIAISNLYIDSGLYGTFAGDLNETFSFGSGDSAFSGNISKITITFDGGPISGSLEGTVTVPYVNLTLETEMGISVEGISFSMALLKDKDVTLADTVTLTVAAGSSVAFEGDVLKAELISRIKALGKLGGDINGEIGATLVIASDGVVKLKNVTGELENWLTCDNVNVNFMNVFSLSLDTIGFGFKNSQLFFGVGGSLCLMEGFDADGSAKVGINIPSGTVWANDIHVGFKKPSAFAFSGRVSILDGAQWGTGFSGEMELSVADIFSAESTLIVGHTGEFPYFYIDGNVQIPDPGIQMSPYPLSFYGFGGGAYLNMMPVDYQNNPGEYEPEAGSFGVRALVTIGTNFDSGYTFNGDLGLEINIATGDDAGFSIALRGESYILCSRTARNENRRIYADATIGCYENSSCAFTSRMYANNFAILDPQKALVSVTGDVDLKFGQDEWYVYMGRKTKPATVAILPFLTGDDKGIGRAQGYFEINKYGVRTGYLVELDSGKRRFLIFYGRVWGGQAADFEVSFDPMFVYAEFSVWIGLEAGVGISGVGDFEIFYAQASLGGGIRTPNPTRLWMRGSLEYRLLGGIVSGMWSMSFSWGEEMPVQLQDNWPCFEVFDPEEDTEGVNIGKPLKVVMTTPVNRKITYQDEEGRDLDVTVRLEEFNVYCTTCMGPAMNRPPLEGQIVWNSSKTSFTFEPEQFLEPNQTYSVEAKARAEGSVLVSGTYTETKAFTFTSGEFPRTIDLMVKNSYPKNARHYCYTGYPIWVEFQRALPILETGNVTGKLFKEDGTEVAGTYTLALDYRSVTFVPDGGLEPNTFYEFKLMKGVVAHSDNESEETASDPGETQPLNETEAVVHSISSTTVQANVFMTEVVEALGDTWLTLKFETGSYSGFKAMLEDSTLNVTASRPEVYTNDELETLRNSPVYNVAFSTREPFYWDELDVQVATQNNRPTGCCERYFEKEERPTLPRQETGTPVEIDTDTSSTGTGYSIYDDPGSGFYGADCHSTIDGSRQITRSANEVLSPRVLGQESGTQGETGQRQGLNLNVRFGRLEVVKDPTDCVFDVIKWEGDINSPYYHGPREVADECIWCINDRIVQGSRISLANVYSPLGNERWFFFTVDLPPVPTEPDEPDDGGGEPQITRPELVEISPQVIEIQNTIFTTSPEYQKPVFLDNLFGPAGDIIDDIPWTTDEGGDLVNEFNVLAQQYQEMVDEFGAMNFGPDLNKQYDTLTQQYSNLGEQYNTLSRQAASVSVNDAANYQGVMNAFQDLNAAFQNLNESFMGLNTGAYIF